MTLSALRDYCLEKNYDFKFWTHVVGWEDMQTEEDKAPTRDRCLNIFDALKKIGDVDGDGKKPWPVSNEFGVYAMVYPHWAMPKLPPFIQLVKDYVYQFSSGGRARLVLIVPENTTLPVELEHEITILEYGLPTKAQIREIFDRVVIKMFEKRNIKNPFSENDIHLCVNLAAGMTEMEVENAFARAVSSFRPYNVVKKTDDYKWAKAITVQKFIEIINDVKTEAIKRTECLSLMEEAGIEDVAGLDLAKQWLTERAHAFTEEARKKKIPRPKGVLFVGPPGTGKSLIAKMTGSILRQRVIRLDMGAIFNKYVGASEERIRKVIKMAKAMAPVVLLIDEVDKAGGNPKQDGGSEATGRVMSTLLTEMQECKEEVFWIFTANWPDRIDPALLRKGRLDERFSVMAATSVEREACLNVHLRKCGHDASKFDMKRLVEATKGFVSAEIEAIVKDAVTIAFAQGDKPLTDDLLVQCASITKPLSNAFPEEFNRMETWAKLHARPSSSPDPITTPTDNAPAPAARTRSRDV